jgi:hypothetical protein
LINFQVAFFCGGGFDQGNQRSCTKVNRKDSGAGCSAVFLAEFPKNPVPNLFQIIF